MAKSPRSKGRGKLLLVAAPVVLLALAGGGYFAWSKVRSKPTARKAATAKKAAPVAVRSLSAPMTPRAGSPKAPPIALDAAAGAGRLAKLWNGVETPRLLAIASAWKPGELAPVLLRMDAAKAAEVISALPPRRASDLSREMRRVASLPEPD